MPPNKNQTLRYVLAHFLDLPDTERAALANELRSAAGSLPRTVEPSSELYFSTQDSLIEDTFAKLRFSPRWKFWVLTRLHFVLVRLNLWSFVLVFFGIIFSTNVAMGLHLGFPYQIGGGVITGLLVGVYFFTKWANKNYASFLFGILTEGDLVWFLRNEVFYFEQESSRSSGRPSFFAKHSLRRTSLSVELARKKVALYSSDKVYKTQTLYLYYLAFDFLAGRSMSIYGETETKQLKIEILKRVLAFVGDSSLVCFLVGMEYYFMNLWPDALVHFEKACLLEPDNGYYQAYRNTAEYLVSSQAGHGNLSFD